MSRDAKELIAFLKAMEFTAITKRVAAHFEVQDLDAIAARADGGQCAAAEKPELPEIAGETPAETGALRAPINHDAYVTVTAANELDALGRASP